MVAMIAFLVGVVFQSPAACAVNKDPYLFVLDMDRLFVKEKAAIYEGTDPAEHFQVRDELYRLAAYTPEFLMALKHYMPSILGAPVRLAIFSAGSMARNVGVVQTVGLNEAVSLSDLIDDVKSFDDLILLKELPSHVPLDQAVSWVRRRGGQDKIPFFDIFTKDLTLFEHRMDRVVIFEDNHNAVPLRQVRQLLVVARPDINENKLLRDNRDSKEHWNKDGMRDAIQIARARYRLVRAIGVLSRAAKAYRDGFSRSLPDALNVVQWGQEGKFRATELNDQSLYQEGMGILEQVYREHLQNQRPALVRSAEYFGFYPVRPRPEDCGEHLLYKDGVLPWQLRP